MSNTKSEAKAPKKTTPRRAARGRKADAMARAQADVEGEAAPELATCVEPGDITTGEVADPIVAELDAKQALDTQCFTSIVEASVPPAGPLVEMPAAPSAAGPRVSLTPDEWLSLAGYANKFHDVKSQIQAFDSGDSSGPAKAPPGTRRLVKLGLVEERKAYFVTELGAHVAQSGGIEVTRPVAKAAVEATS